MIKIKTYIRTLFHKLRKTYSNIQRIKCSSITLKGYVLRSQTTVSYTHLTLPTNREV